MTKQREIIPVHSSLAHSHLMAGKTQPPPPSSSPSQDNNRDANNSIFSFHSFSSYTRREEEIKNCVLLENVIVLARVCASHSLNFFRSSMNYARAATGGWKR